MSSSGEDGRKPLSAAEFAAKLRPKPAVDHPLEVQLAASTDSLRRQLAFIGNDGFVEFQALGVRRSQTDSYERARAIHVATSEQAVEACREADQWVLHGIYILPNVLNSGTETRHSAPGAWYDLPKGATTDSDIACRLILAIDFDAQRPSGTSASDTELERSIHVALKAWKYLECAFGDANAMAYLHSGNGRQIHLALDRLPNDDECKRFASAVLIGMASLFDTPEVKVDKKLFDAKRILPACGTLKKKGAAGISDRPHRRTAIVTPDVVRRLRLDDLKQLCRSLWNETDSECRNEMAKALGKQLAPKVSALSPAGDSPYDRVNQVPPSDVASWLGLLDGEQAVCPGCGSSDSGVAVIRSGFKCSHNRCQGLGINGFRTNVDLVSEVRGIEPKEAVNVIAEQFHLDVHVSEPSAPTTSFSPINTSSFQWISTSEIFEPLPPTKWLVPDLQLVSGRPTMLAGYGFSGKTLMAQALAIAIASGSSVWGRFNPGSPSAVRHLDYEQGRHATLKRYQRIALGHGIRRDSIDNRLQVAVFPDVYLDSPNAQDAYARAVEGIPLVMLDALRGATPTIDENDSTIRRCIDNLSRVSEKTGTAFLILHHAGKTGAADGDARKVPRGSSAIFDACGCIFVVEGEEAKPKRIQQTKAPAEAEGGSIPEFFLSIEDVSDGSNPTAGLRVVCQETSKARAQTGVSAKFESLKAAIMELVASNPTLTSANAVCERVSGGRKDSKLTAIQELLSEGKLCQPGGSGTPIRVGSGPGPNSVPTGPIGKSGPVPRSPSLKTGPETGTTPPGTGRQEEAEAKRRSQAAEDAGTLLKVTAKERSQYALAEGWSEERTRRAKGALALREAALRKDIAALQAVAGDVDPSAWATEQGWSDERIKEALPGVTVPFREPPEESGIRVSVPTMDELVDHLVEGVRSYPKITMPTLISWMHRRFGSSVDVEAAEYEAKGRGLIRNVVVKGLRHFELEEKK